eukprot:Nk52_evm91s1073 gene=Nk52_evmTU91s1073
MYSRNRLFGLFATAWIVAFVATHVVLAELADKYQRCHDKLPLERCHDKDDKKLCLPDLSEDALSCCTFKEFSRDLNGETKKVHSFKMKQLKRALRDIFEIEGEFEEAIAKIKSDVSAVDLVFDQCTYGKKPGDPCQFEYEAPNYAVTNMYGKPKDQFRCGWKDIEDPNSPFECIQTDACFTNKNNLPNTCSGENSVCKPPAEYKIKDLPENRQDFAYVCGSISKDDECNGTADVCTENESKSPGYCNWEGTCVLANNRDEDFCETIGRSYVHDSFETKCIYDRNKKGVCLETDDDSGAFECGAKPAPVTKAMLQVKKFFRQIISFSWW